jgi:hypothetical protein
MLTAARGLMGILPNASGMKQLDKVIYLHTLFTQKESTGIKESSPKRVRFFDSKLVLIFNNSYKSTVSTRVIIHPGKTHGPERNISAKGL